MTFQKNVKSCFQALQEQIALIDMTTLYKEFFN